MAFQIKDFVSITASMVNWVRATTKKVTDFSIGSVVRTMLEAVATEIEELYQQMFIGLKEAIPVSVYNSFEFGLLPAESASNLVRVTVTSSTDSTLISANTAFTLSNGKVYRSNVDITIDPSDTFADVPVSAAIPGTVGNIGASQSFVMTPSPNNFVSATNLSAFNNGREAETEDERKLRFNAFILALTRGTVAAIEYALNNLVSLKDVGGNVTERVRTSGIIEPWILDNTQPISLVKFYIHNGVGSTSSDLLARANEVIYGYTDANGVKVPGWKAAGVKVTGFIATEVPLNVSGALTALAGYDESALIDQAESLIYSYLQGLPIGASAVKAEIVRIVKQIPGVYNIVFSGLADETTATNAQKIMPGTIALT